jgi:hypothetical protein
MGRAERRKGATGEREVAGIFGRFGFDLAKRSGDAGQRDGDLDHVGNFYVEVRRRETLEILAWLREVAGECPPGLIGLLVFRRSRMPWHVSLPLGPFLALVGDVDLCATVRSRKTFQVAWLREAEPRPAQLAVLVFRRPGMPWHVCLRLEELLGVLRSRGEA